jgi:FAD/FMN-containing dehydrogenase
VLTCSPEQNADVFWATIGGMGLTGVILSARFRLTPVETAYCRVDYQRTADLDETLRLFGETNELFRYSVAWIDCLGTGKSLGRSVVMLGNDALRSDLARRRQASPLELPSPRDKSVPFHFPNFALSPLTVKIFNSIYYARHGDGRKIVDFNTYFYPLDGVLHWNRIYGRRGFIQYQALFPPQTAHAGLHEMMEAISASRQASFLAVLKSSGAANPGMLSYLYPGFTLALDFPYCGERTERIVKRLDDILLAHGGRLYLAKDATMTREAFAVMYPRLAEFRQVKARIDPHNRFVSSQARRLGIVDVA